MTDHVTRILVCDDSTGIENAFVRSTKIASVVDGFWGGDVLLKPLFYTSTGISGDHVVQKKYLNLQTFGGSLFRTCLYYTSEGRTDFQFSKAWE